MILQEKGKKGKTALYLKKVFSALQLNKHFKIN